MSKELDTFDKWWMMQSKMPYRDKKEIARSAWEQSRTARRLMMSESDCQHQHSGSCSPEGIYLYVRCNDCGELLAISDEGKKRLSECDGYRPSRTGHTRACLDCGFDYYDHNIDNLKEKYNDR